MCTVQLFIDNILTQKLCCFLKTKKPCCRMETARCHCKFSSIRRVPGAYAGEYRHIWFYRTGNSAIRFIHPTPKTLNMEWIVDRITRCWDMAITYHEGAFILREGEVVGDHWWYHWKEQWWFPIHETDDTTTFIDFQREFNSHLLRISVGIFV